MTIQMNKPLLLALSAAIVSFLLFATAQAQDSEQNADGAKAKNPIIGNVHVGVACCGLPNFLNSFPKLKPFLGSPSNDP